ncbi:MAG TPA: hypothetical protein VG297_07635, partial [Bryobacteraceae bacterium]|nr:hypothetical protein [Bryobacteraceae bacterium]
MNTTELDPKQPVPSADIESRMILQPIAAPSILGLYGLAGATFMVAAHTAQWFGASTLSNLMF